jgi:hypothetical protein
MSRARARRPVTLAGRAAGALALSLVAGCHGRFLFEDPRVSTGTPEPDAAALDAGNDRRVPPPVDTATLPDAPPLPIDAPAPADLALDRGPPEDTVPAPPDLARDVSPPDLSPPRDLGGPEAPAPAVCSATDPACTCVGTSCVCKTRQSCFFPGAGCESPGGRCSLTCQTRSQCVGQCAHSCSAECIGGSTCRLTMGDNGFAEGEGSDTVLIVTVGPMGRIRCEGTATCHGTCTADCSLTCGALATCDLQCAGAPGPRVVTGTASCP